MKFGWKQVIFVGGVVAIASVTYALAQGKKAELPTVRAVDLNRYAGRWYEIARYPNRFQKQCVGNTAATYTVKANGKIEVKNECLKKNGKTEVAVGEAKVVKGSSNSKLKVHFAPSFISWLPFVWGDYWVIDLGANYEYSVIGDPGRDYFWILGREPKMSEAQYQEILRRAEKLGFDPNKVQKTPQNVEVLKGNVVEKS